MLDDGLPRRVYSGAAPAPPLAASRAIATGIGALHHDGTRRAAPPQPYLGRDVRRPLAPLTTAPTVVERAPLDASIAPPPRRRRAAAAATMSPRASAHIVCGALCPEGAQLRRVLRRNDERHDEAVQAERGAETPDEHHANVELGLAARVLHAAVAAHANGEP